MEEGTHTAPSAYLQSHLYTLILSPFDCPLSFPLPPPTLQPVWLLCILENKTWEMRGKTGVVPESYLLRTFLRCKSNNFRGSDNLSVRLRRLKMSWKSQRLLTSLSVNHRLYSDQFSSHGNIKCGRKQENLSCLVTQKA